VAGEVAYAAGAVDFGLVLRGGVKRLWGSQRMTGVFFWSSIGLLLARSSGVIKMLTNRYLLASADDFFWADNEFN
jgi:hypothetical protein